MKRQSTLVSLSVSRHAVAARTARKPVTSSRVYSKILKWTCVPRLDQKVDTDDAGIGDDVTTTITETREDTSQPIMAKSAERIPGTTIRHRTRDDGCCSVNFLKYVLHIYNVVLFYVFVVMLVFLQEVGVGVLSRLYEEQVGPELKTNLNRTFLENYSVWSTETAAIDQMQIEFKCCGALRFEDWLVSEWRKDEDVLKDLRLVPDSCCKTPTHLCGRRDHPSNIHYTGCIYKFLETTKDHLIILGAVGLGLSVLELFGIVLGSCLYIKLRHDFDD
ncbi:CD151 antigen [Augochlora pura]